MVPVPAVTLVPKAGSLGPEEVAVPLLTVATAVLEETHALLAAGVPEPVSADVPPTQAANVPVIVGAALTVIVTVFDVAGEPVRHGLALDVITTITASPFANAALVYVWLFEPTLAPFSFHW